MKSHIDWNEMFPRLKKELRETLLLEAVTIISAGRPHKTNGEAKADRVHTADKRKKRSSLGHRFWKVDGDGGKLYKPTRTFKVIVSNAATVERPHSRLAKVWAVLTKHGTDTISGEALADLVSNAGLNVHATISQLWSTRRIDIVK